MFDIGFSEMMVIALIALIVLGPEKLPRLARTAGHLLGRMQRYVNDVKGDINREIELDELRKLQKEMQGTAQAIEQSVTGQVHSVESEFKQLSDSTHQALSEPVAPPVAEPVPDPVADAFADPPPVQAATAQPLLPVIESPVVATVSPQLELELESVPLANAPPPPSPLAPTTAKA